jgi:ATP-dependent protease ClpP protease subunit
MLKKIILIIFLYCSALNSFSGIEEMSPFFSFKTNESGNILTLDGGISLITTEKLTRFLKGEYYRYSKDPQNRSRFRELSKQVDIKKITYLINTNEAFNNNDKNKTKLIFKYLLMMEVKKLIVNSPGGHLDEIMPLALLVKELGISIHVKKDGMCASACSFLFHKASKRTMGDNSQLMYHLGIIQQGEDILHINTCHAFSMENCKLSPALEYTLEEYKEFILGLPSTIQRDVLDGKDRFVRKREAYTLGIIE